MTASSTRAITDRDERFVLWCAEQLRLEVQRSDEAIRLTIPKERVDVLGDAPSVTMALRGDRATVEARGTEAAVEADRAAARGPADTRLSAEAVIDWMVELLRRDAAPAGGGVLHSRPKRQPESVHELSERLFSRYTIDGGRVHLGGCTLEDCPLVRVTTRHRGPAGRRVRHSFWYLDGHGVPDSLVAALGLEELERFDPPRGRSALGGADPLDAIRQTACRQDGAGTDTPGDQVECLATTIVWCKFAEGKLRFQAGEAVAELPFSDWAATLEPPPFACGASGAAGFHLAATTDGRITLADQIAACEISGDRVLKRELAECSVSGCRVLPKYLATCPVSGDRLLPDHLATCAVCRQQVAPQVIETSVCRSCRQMARIARDDPRLVRLLDRHPDFDRRLRFYFAETETCWILRGVGLLGERLLVVDRQTLDARYRASRWRVARHFTPAP